MKHSPKEALKTIGLLFLGFVVTFALFRFIIYLSESLEMMWIYYVGTSVYAVAVIVLFCAFYVLNGFTLSRPEYTREDLPDKWSEEKKTEFLEKLPQNREKAKSLLFILMPLVVTLLVSYIGLTLFQQ